MGIPHLYSNLRPYSRQQTFPPGTPVIIDGPALAYHVYYQLGEHTPATPYITFQAALITYLDALLSCRLDIKHLYFDGALPSSKRPTRISRLTSYLTALRTFHALHPQSPPSRTLVPIPPPFIITAALSALYSHPRYSQLTTTVPGEADGYCARSGIAAAGVVLTGDSDLLLFTGGGRTRWGVAMLKDFLPKAETGTASGRVFYHADVAAVLGVDLKVLGYLLEQDATAPLTVLQQRCRGFDKTSWSWREFAACYDMSSQIGRGSLGKAVDPRIAEIIHLRTVGGTKEMFLPFLYEDPSRASAWETGRGIRALAYSLLFPGTAAVEEVCRSGDRIVPVLVPVPTNSLLEIQSVTSEDDLPRFVVRQVPEAFISRGRVPPGRDVLDGLASMLSCGGSFSVRSAGAWDRVHVLAMVQAGWYSLLMLKEVLKLQGREVGALEGLMAVGVVDGLGGGAGEQGGRDLGEANLVGKKKNKKKEGENQGGVTAVGRGGLGGNRFAVLELQ